MTGSATAELDSLCQGRVVNGRRIPALNPVHPDIAILFAAVLAGAFTINGFRNRDLQAKLYRDASHDPIDARRRTHRVSRLIAKLRAHGLVAKVKDSRLYRVTARGIKAMWPAIRFRRIDFPAAYNAA